MLLDNILPIMKGGVVTKIIKNNQKVIGLAKKVEQQSDKYKSQLKKCQKRLNKNKYIIF